jgi:hypothetical protein
MAINLKLINVQSGEVVKEVSVANQAAAYSELENITESVQVVWEEE